MLRRHGFTHAGVGRNALAVEAMERQIGDVRNVQREASRGDVLQVASHDVVIMNLAA